VGRIYPTTIGFIRTTPSALYDGILMVTEPDNFRASLQTGIGHGKAMGLGLISVAPIA